MSSNTSGALDETHEVHEPSTFTNFSRQRQRQSATFHPALPSTQSPSRPSSTSSSPRPLRRITPRLEDRRVSYPVDVAGLNASSPRFAERAAPITPQSAPVPAVAAPIRPALSEAETEGAESTAHDSEEQHPDSYWPVRSTRVSPRTASAILWVLEEGIRKPFPFTTDWEEVNASMSDLVSGGGSPGLGGNVRSQNGGSRQGPVPVHTHPPSGVRTPTDIMRQRRDREARKKAEKEAKEREQQEAEWRQQQEQAQTQQYAAAGVAGQTTSQRNAGADATQTTGFQQTAPASAGTRRQDPQVESRVTGNGGTQERQRGATVSQGQPRPVPTTSQQPVPTSTTYSQQQLHTQTKGPGMTAQTASQAAPGVSQGQPMQAQSNQSAASQPHQQPRRAPFPHAFERWETLSSHWEGLTGYWIRKLEQNNEELSRDPLSQQMSRQITDLSAAGANLFHAVVELQRLRASSERKFQRWFFDTRAEQERAREAQAELQRQLRAEQQERAEAVASLRKMESEKKKAEELVKEMRRELQISKEEARRAWEELGRREQEERDRTASLRNGEPTLVGGVQVVPMIPRQTGTTQPPTREGPYPGGSGTTGMGGQAGQQPTETAEESQYYEQQPASPTETDPFTEPRRPLPEPGPRGYGQTPASTTMSGARPTTSHGQGQSTGRFYQHEGSALRGGASTSENPARTGNDTGEDYAVDPDGGYRNDSQGRQIVYPPAMSEGSDYDEPDEEQGYGRHYTSGGEYGSVSAPTATTPLYSGYTPDYSGSGWGVGTGWDSVTPRHRHPTRLSDVIEEDERSRTSPSRASQASRGAQ